MNENQQMPPEAKRINKTIILILLQVFGGPFIFFQMIGGAFTNDNAVVYIGYAILVTLAVIGLYTSIRTLARKGRDAGISFVILLITSLILTAVIALPFLASL